jgi:hypothetical protein
MKRKCIVRDTFDAPERRVVSMILVNGHDERRAIEHRYVLMQSIPDHPAVPIAMPHQERRHIQVLTSAEKKQVDPELVLPECRGLRKLPQLVEPLAIGEVDWRRNVGIPPLCYQKKLLPPRPRSLESLYEIRHQYNVAVHEAAIFVVADFLSARKYVIQPLRAGFVPLHPRFMPQLEVRASLGHSLFISKKNHFNVWMQPLPTVQRIPLNDPVVSPERLCGSEERQHLSQLAERLANTDLR